MRADIYISKVKNISRSRAADLIKRGLVCIDGVDQLDKDSLVYGSPEVSIADEIHINKVGRGYEKLAFAATHFKIHFKDKVCLDIGSSTGGFTQFMHEQGAKKVIAVDVGIDQMHESLRKKAEATGSIEIYENQDIRLFNTTHNIDCVVCDISFISLSYIIDHIYRLAPRATWLLLFKPQFEVGKEYNHTGVVSDTNIVQQVLEAFCLRIKEMRPRSHVVYHQSHILGGDGNKEFWINVFE